MLLKSLVIGNQKFYSSRLTLVIVKSPNNVPTFAGELFILTSAQGKYSASFFCSKLTPEFES